MHTPPRLHSATTLTVESDRDEMTSKERKNPSQSLPPSLTIIVDPDEFLATSTSPAHTKIAAKHSLLFGTVYDRELASRGVGNCPARRGGGNPTIETLPGPVLSCPILSCPALP